MNIQRDLKIDHSHFLFLYINSATVTVSPSELVQLLMFLTCILEVPYLDLGQDIIILSLLLFSSIPSSK
jgi:hypothetical protein